MVFERLAATMRASALALVLTAVLLAGCGSSDKSAGPNGEASKPASQVLADAKKAATNASSAHVSGDIRSNGTPITLDPLTNLGALFAGISSQHGKLVNDGKTTYKGAEVVAIRDTSDNSKLYVAATGKPYPVALIGGKKDQSGTITFDDWNKSVSLSAPSSAIDISKFGG
jgi:uncharacterized protein involved in outer membrane biogenesis